MARHHHTVTASQAGVIVGFDTEAIGRAGMVLGAGRAKTSDTIDPAVGLAMQVRLGERLEVGQPIAIIDYNDPALLERAQPILWAAVKLGETAPAPLPLVRERLP